MKDHINLGEIKLVKVLIISLLCRKKQIMFLAMVLGGDLSGMSSADKPDIK